MLPNSQVLSGEPLSYYIRLVVSERGKYRAVYHETRNLVAFMDSLRLSTDLLQVHIAEVTVSFTPFKQQRHEKTSD